VNRLIIAPALLLFLPAAQCGEGARPTVEFPQLPDLPAETVKECPAPPLLTGGLADLITKDALLAIEYARCRARKDSAVGAYQDAQRLLREADAKANGKKPAGAQPEQP
jgi:hypothetical protein